MMIQKLDGLSHSLFLPLGKQILAKYLQIAAIQNKEILERAAGGMHLEVFSHAKYGSWLLSGPSSYPNNSSKPV